MAFIFRKRGSIMARRATEPKYYASRGAYYVTHQGRQWLLAQGAQDDPAVIKAAWDAFLKLTNMPLPLPQSKADVTFGEILDAFCRYSTAHKSEGTASVIQWHSRKAKDGGLGQLRVAALLPVHFDHYIIGTGWGRSTRRIAYQTLTSALNWAAKSGLIDKNPWSNMPDLMKGKVAVRTEEHMVTEEEHKTMTAAAHPTLRAFLSALWLSGARPGEVARLEASMLVEEGGVRFFRLTRHKNKEKGKDRTIFLTPALEAIVREQHEILFCTRQLQSHPSKAEGPIFRNAWGLPWTRVSMVQAVGALRDRCKVNPKITAYSWRHAYITRHILGGTPLAVIAEMCGNSVQTIMKCYSHLLSDKKTLAAAACRFAS
jgi:integrase